MKAPVSIRAFAPEDMDAVIDLLQDVSAFRPDAETVSVLAEAFASQANCYACVATQDCRLIPEGRLAHTVRDHA